MPYRQNAESLQQVLDDAIELAMAPAGANRRVDLQRMVERIDSAVALAGTSGDAGGADIVESLRSVRDVLLMKASSTRRTGARSSTSTSIEDAEARASPRGIQLRILEVMLKESAVGAALVDVALLSPRSKVLSERSRARLTAAVELLRERYETGQTQLRLAVLEPCSELHAQLLNGRFDRLEDDLRRLFDGWQRGQRRLARP